MPNSALAQGPNVLGSDNVHGNGRDEQPANDNAEDNQVHIRDVQIVRHCLMA